MGIRSRRELSGIGVVVHSFIAIGSQPIGDGVPELEQSALGGGDNTEDTTCRI